MKMKNTKWKKNIIWIVVDAVRNYKANDKYGKLDIMQEFAKESVEFTNAVSSAPSTLMSVGAMIASKPAYHLSRDFEIFEYDQRMFPPLTAVLKSNSYNNYTIHHYPQSREKMNHILSPVSPKYWPQQINKHKLWNEDEINSIFKNLIKKGIKEPFFLYVHYDVPTNNKFASNKVKSVLRKLKEKNIYDDSIIILCSDHGYPDPRRKKLSLKQKVLEGHDLFVTDDNIMMPLLIKYPNCPKGLKVTEMVSSLDIAPTILEILEIPYVKCGFEGLNLLKIIDGEKTPKRKIRTDTRYCFQPKKVTSLRSNKYKYVRYLDEQLGKKEKFFNLEQDRWEQRNLIHSNNKEIINKINEFRKEFLYSEERSIKIQKKYLQKKFETLLYKRDYRKIKKILIFGSADTLFVDILLANILQSLGNVSIDVIIKRNSAQKLEINSKKINFIFSNLTYNDFKKRLKKLKNARYDLIIIPFANRLGIGYNQIFKIAKQFKKDKIITVDYNMDLIIESNMWVAILKHLSKDLMVNLLDWKNFSGRLVLLAKRIIFDKYY